VKKQLAAATVVLALLGCGETEQAGAKDEQAASKGEQTTAENGDPEQSGAKDEQAASKGEQAIAENGDPEPSGTLTMKSWKVALIGSAGQSKGTVTFQGKQRKFKMTGLGIGGFGVSTSTATGVIYNMKTWEDFTGAYSSGRSGVTLGDNELLKDRSLWLRNAEGVSIKLTTEKSGIELNLGVDGSVIQWDD